MNDVLRCIVLLVCLGVLVAAACRVNRLNSAKDDKFSWVVMYTAYAAAALAVAVDLLERLGDPVSDGLTHAEGLALAGIALNLWLTRKRWQHGPPSVAKKG